MPENNLQEFLDKKYYPSETTIKNPTDLKSFLDQKYSSNKQSRFDPFNIKPEVDNSDIDSLEHTNSDEKDYLKNLRSNGALPVDVENAKLVLSGKHPKQEGFYSWYKDDKGMAIPLAPGEKPPKGKGIESVWGSQESAEDDGIFMTMGKNLANAVPQFVGAIGDVAATVQTLATGAEPQWSKEMQERLKSFELKTSEASNAEIYNTENIKSFKDLLDPSRFDFTPENVAGGISQAAGSILQFMAANALTGGLGGASKAVQAGRILETAVAGSKAANIASKAMKVENIALKGKQLLAGTTINLGEGLQMGREAGLEDRELFGFGLLVALPVSMVEMNLGLTAKLLNNPEAKSELSGIFKEAGKKLIKDADGKITDASLKEVVKEMGTKSASYGAKWAEKIIKGGAPEAGEEMLQGFIQDGSAQIYDTLFGEGKSVGEGKFGIDALSPESFGKRINEGILGFMAGGLGSVRDKTPSRSKNAYNVVKNGETTAFKAEAVAALKNGRITQSEYENAIERVNAYDTYEKETKGTKIKPEAKERSFGLIFTNESINKEIKAIEAEESTKTIKTAKLKPLNAEHLKNEKELTALFEGKSLEEAAAIVAPIEKTPLTKASTIKKPEEKKTPKVPIKKTPSTPEKKTVGIYDELISSIKKAKTVKDIDAFVAEADKLSEKVSSKEKPVITPVEVIDEAAKRRSVIEIEDSKNQELSPTETVPLLNKKLKMTKSGTTLGKVVEPKGKGGKLSVEINLGGIIRTVDIASSSIKKTQGPTGEKTTYGTHGIKANKHIGKNVDLVLVKDWNKDSKIINKATGKPYIGDKIEIYPKGTPKNKRNSTTLLGNVKETDIEAANKTKKTEEEINASRAAQGLKPLSKESTNPIVKENKPEGVEPKKEASKEERPKLKPKLVGKIKIKRSLKDKIADSNNSIDDFFSDKTPISILLGQERNILKAGAAIGITAIHTGEAVADAIKKAIDEIIKQFSAKNITLSEEEQKEVNDIIGKIMQKEDDDFEAMLAAQPEGETLTASTVIEVLKQSEKKINEALQSFGLSGEQRFNQLKIKVKSLYENVDGFDTVEEIERKMMKLFKAKPDFNTNTQESINQMLASNNAKTVALGEHFNKYSPELKVKNLVSLLSVFQSMNAQPAYYLYKGKGKEITMNPANLSLESTMLEIATNKLNSFNDISFQNALADFRRERNNPKNKEKGDRHLFDLKFMEKLTGINANTWKSFLYAKSFKTGKGGYDILVKNKSKFVDGKTFEQWSENRGNGDSNITAFIINDHDDYESFKKYVLQGLNKKGSPLNTIVLNTPFKDQIQHIKSKYKNVLYNLKNSYSGSSHLEIQTSKIGNDEYQNSPFYAKNKFVKFYKDKVANLIYSSGIVFPGAENKADNKSMSENDLRKTLAQMFNAIGDDTYYQSTGQFGDSNAIAFLEVPKYNDLAKLKKDYHDKLIEQGHSEEYVNEQVEKIDASAKKYVFADSSINAELFVWNHAYNFNEVNEFYNGNDQQYVKEGKDINDSMSLIKDIVKRAKSMASPGIMLDRFVKGGIGETHRMVVIELPEVEYKTPDGKIVKKVKQGDGQSFISRIFSNKIKTSSGTYNFHTNIKAITSFTTPDGLRVLDKTHSMTVDELAEKHGGVYKQIADAMKEHGIDKITTIDGAKKTAGIKPWDMNTPFSEEHVITVDNKYFSVQQDLNREGVMEKGSIPKQQLKNHMIAEENEAVTRLYNANSNDKAADILRVLTSANKALIRRSLIDDLRSRMFNEDTGELESETSDDALTENKKQLLEYLENGVELEHPKLEKWVVNFIGNKISNDALDRITNRVQAADVAYIETPDFKLDDVHVINGKVSLPTIAVSETTGLRGPTKMLSKDAAIKHIKENRDEFEDMFNESGDIYEHEIYEENGQVFIPGEYVRLTRVPADDMHSHPVGRVKYLLPAISKNIIITPHGIQDIAGFDYDGDGHFVEGFFKRTVKNPDGSVKRVYKKGASQQSIANQAFKKSVEWYYKPESQDILYRRIDKETDFDATLDKLSGKLYLEKDGPESFIKMRTLYQVGLKVVGAMANHLATFDYLRKHNVSFYESKGIHFPNFTLSNNGVLSFDKKTKKNKFDYDLKVKALIANLQNIALDNGNELKIETLGLNEVTVNWYVPLMMMGHNVESLAAFFNYPSVVKAVERIRASKDVSSKEDSFNVLKNMGKELFPKMDKIAFNKVWSNKSPNILEADDFTSISPYKTIKILKKLNELNTLNFDLGHVRSMITASEKAATSYGQWYNQVDSILKVTDLFEEHKLNIINNKSFKDSIYTQNAKLSTGSMRTIFNKFSSMGLEVSKEIQAEFESINARVKNIKTKIGDIQVAKLKKEEIEKVAKAIERIILSESRNMKKSFNTLQEDLTLDIRNNQDNQKSKFKELYSVFEIQDGTVSIREDLKKLDIPNLSELQNMLSEMYFSEDAQEKELADNIVNYAALKYNLTESKFGGSFAELLDVNIQKEIGDSIKIIKDSWRQGKSNYSQKKYIEEIIKNNPELEFVDVNEADLIKNKIYDLFNPGLIVRDKLEKNISISEAQKAGVFENLPLFFVEEIVTGKKVPVAAQKTERGISLVKNLIIQKFNEKAWTKPVMQRDKSFATGIAANRFKTVDEFFTFIILHEKAHEYILRNENEETGPYEDRVNAEALRRMPDGGQAQKSSTQKEITTEQRIKLIETLKKAIPNVEVVLDGDMNVAGLLTKNGKTVKLNPNYNFLDTPIHEFGHALIDMMGGLSNPFIAKGVNQLRGTKLWNKVALEYPELNDEMLAKEVLATAIGNEGAILFEKMYIKTGFRNWLSVMFLKLKIRLGIEKNVARQLANILLSKKDIQLETVATGTEQKAKLKFGQILEGIKEVSDSIDFNEATHTYKFGGKVLESVTTRIKSLINYSYDGPETQEFEINSTIGSSIHGVLEDIIKDIPQEESNKRNDFADKKVFQDIYDQLTSIAKMIKKDGAVLSEVRVANFAQGIAGTVDIIVERADGSLDIWDLKTSKNSTDLKSYTTAWGRKKSLADKHAIQLSTYASILKMGDPDMGLSGHEINSLNIIPMHLTIDSNGKVTNAVLEQRKTYGFHRFENEIKLTVLPPNKFEIAAPNSGITTWEQYAQADGYSLEKHRLRRNELIKGQLKNQSIEDKNELKSLLLKESDLQKEFEQFKIDRENIETLRKNKGDISKMDMPALTSLYHTIKRMNNVAGMHYLEEVLVKIGYMAEKIQLDFVETKQEGFDRTKVVKTNLQGFDITHKALSDMGVEQADLQFLSVEYKKRMNDISLKTETMIGKGHRLFQEMANEYNKNNGIKEKVVNFLSEDNSIYQKNLINPKTGAFKSTRDKSLSPAEKAFVEFILTTKESFRGVHQRSIGKFDKFAIIKNKASTKELVGLYGLWQGYIASLGSDSQLASIKMYFNKGKANQELLSLSQIKDKLSTMARGGIISKIKAIALITSYNLKAKNLLRNDEGLNEDGSRIKNLRRSDITIDKKGVMKSKYGKELDKNVPFSKDYYRAFLDYGKEMIFIQNMESIMPVLEGIETLNKQLGNMENTVKFLEIWKKGNILGEKIVNIDARLDTVLRFLRTWTRNLFMTFNIKAGGFNYLMGRFNQYRDQDASKFFVGDKRILESLAKANGHLRSEKNRAWNIANNHMFIAFELPLSPKKGITRYFDLMAFGIQEHTENLIKTTSALSLISDEIYYNWFNDAGDIIGKDAEEIAKRTKEFSAIASAARNRIENVQGKYSKEEWRNFMHYESGRFFYQFRVWLPDLIVSRFGKKIINTYGDSAEGSYRTFFRIASSELRKDLATKEFWKGDTMESKNMRKNFKEFVAIAGATVLYLAASGDDDDKEAANILSRLLNEMMGVYSLNTLRGIVSGPAASLQTVERVIDALEAAIFQIEYKRDSKYNKKGDKKIWGAIERITPYNNFLTKPRQFMHED